jgi:hypothetical protein
MEGKEKKEDQGYPEFAAAGPKKDPNLDFVSFVLIQFFIKSQPCKEGPFSRMPPHFQHLLF